MSGTHSKLKWVVHSVIQTFKQSWNHFIIKIHPRFQASCNVLDTDGKTPLRLAAGRVDDGDIWRRGTAQWGSHIKFRGPNNKNDILLGCHRWSGNLMKHHYFADVQLFYLWLDLGVLYIVYNISISTNMFAGNVGFKRGFNIDDSNWTQWIIAKNKYQFCSWIFTLRKQAKP